jgi:hypothetical protein
VCFLNIVLDILKVPSHSSFKELLGIADVDLARRIALDCIDNDSDPADVAILAGFCSGSAVAISCFKI